MKRNVLVPTIALLVIITVSCVKKKNCECGSEGWIVTFEEPLYYEMADSKIYAIFYNDNGGIELFYRSLPHSWRKNDSTYVSICYEGDYSTDDHIAVSKLLCIEEITE